MPGPLGSPSSATSICSRSDLRRSSRSSVTSGPEGRRAELEPALGGDAPVRLEVVPLHLQQRLGRLPRALADELGADRVIGLAEEPAVRAGTGHLADALAAERPGQEQVAGNLGAVAAGTDPRESRPRDRPPSR